MSEGLTLNELLAEQNQGLNFLCLPTPAKLLQVGLGDDDYTFGFLVNKGYLETEDLDLMIILLNALDSYDDIKLVGDTERIVYTVNNIAHYRQRIFFRDLNAVLSICQDFGLYIYVPNDCLLGIHHILGIKHNDLLSLDRYAIKNNLRIDEWLNLTFLYQLYLFFEEQYTGYLTTNTLQSCQTYLNNIRKPEIVETLNSKSIMETYLINSPYFIYNYNLDINMEALYFWNDKDNLADTSSLFGYTRKAAKRDFPDIFEDRIKNRREGQLVENADSTLLN